MTAIHKIGIRLLACTAVAGYLLVEAAPWMRS